MPTVKVEVLRCLKCGAPVPLGAGRHVDCTFCGQTTPIPQSHVALQRARRAFADNRELAEQLYGELGRPPTWLTRQLGRGATTAAPFATRFAGLLVAALMNPLGWPLAMLCCWVISWPVAAVIRLGNHVAYGPVVASAPLTPWLVLPWTYVAVFVSGALPFLRWRRERRLRDVRIAAHASLAAVPPTHPGGPSLCRECGAALDVPSGVKGAPCLYCGTDNLVALSPDWVRVTRENTRTHYSRIDQALVELRAANASAREDYWRLFLLAFPSGLLTLLLAWMMETFLVFY